jgi:hypothetical protein
MKILCRAVFWGTASFALAWPSSDASARTLLLPAAENAELLGPVLESAGRLRALLAERGIPLVDDAAAAREVERVLPFPRAGASPMAPLIADARRTFYYEQDAGKARALLDKVRRDTTDCAELRGATLLAAVIAFQQNDKDAAARLIEEALRADPALHLPASDYPPPVRALFAGVKARLDGGAAATVTVIARPAGIPVHVGVCRSGTGPFTLPKVYAGTYDVWAEGGRVRRVEVGGAPVTVEVDRDFEQALRTTPALALVGPSEVRTPAVAARAAKLVGAEEVLVLEIDRANLTARAVRSVDGQVLRQESAPSGALADLATFLASGERVGLLKAMPKPEKDLAELPEQPPPQRSCSELYWYCKWWVWTLVGAGVGGAAFGAYRLGTRNVQGPASVVVSGGAP